MIAGTKVHLILKKDIAGTHACLCFGFTKKEYIFLKVINNWIGFLNLQFVLFLLERLENSESTLQKKKDFLADILWVSIHTKSRRQKWSRNLFLLQTQLSHKFQETQVFAAAEVHV